MKQLSKYCRDALENWVKVAACVSLSISVVPLDVGAQTALPPSVQADLLKSKIVDAVKAGKTDVAMKLIRDFHGLEAQGINVPQPLLLFEAKEYHKRSEEVPAFDVLTKYLNAPKQSDQEYSVALRLYEELESNP